MQRDAGAIVKADGPSRAVQLQEEPLKELEEAFEFVDFDGSRDIEIQEIKVRFTFCFNANNAPFLKKLEYSFRLLRGPSGLSRR